MSINHTRNNHHRVNRIQRVPQFLPCKHEKPECFWGGGFVLEENSLSKLGRGESSRILILQTNIIRFRNRNIFFFVKVQGPICGCVFFRRTPTIINRQKRNEKREAMTTNAIAREKWKSRRKGKRSQKLT